MKFNQRTLRGLKFMSYLGKNTATRGFYTRTTSRVLEIKNSHLEEIAQTLRRNGLLVKKYGVHGGFNLAKKPENISLFDVCVALEESLDFGMVEIQKVLVDKLKKTTINQDVRFY